MLALAKYTLKGPYQAAVAVGLLAVLSVFVPLLMPNTVIGVFVATVGMLLSCVLVGLVILVRGITSGLRAIAFAVVGITLIGWIVVGSPDLGIWTALVQWLPIILLAQTLRTTESLSMMLLAGAVLAVFGVAVQYLVWPDLQSTWMEIGRQQLQELALPDEVMDRNLQVIAWIAEGLVAIIYLLLAQIVLTARWLQGRIMNPGGFRKDFLAISMGRTVAIGGALLLALSMLVEQSWVNSIAWLVMVLFLFQGVAICHGWLAGKRQSGFFLGMYYALLMILPQIVALTSVVGLIDNWLNLRKRFGGSNETDTR